MTTRVERRWNVRWPWLHAAVLLLWVAASAALAPVAIRAFYEGRILSDLSARLNLAGRHELGHYLALWRMYAVAVGAGIAIHAALLRLPAFRGLSSRSRWVYGVYAAAFLGGTVLCGPRQDYQAYLEIWDVVRGGGDPWWVAPERGYPLNAYGPLFPLMAWPAGLSGLLPKVLFAGVYLGWLLCLWEKAARLTAQGSRAGWVWLGFGMNPSFWTQVAWYGHFDVVVGVTILAALSALKRGDPVSSGAWLGLGTLLKLVPVVTIPAVGATAWRVRPRLVGTALGVILAGFSGAWLIWGEGVLRPLSFAATRGSNLLSIYRFLRGAYSPLRWVSESPNLDGIATPVMVVALALVWGYCQRARTDPGTTTIAVLLTTLLLYRVGFVQYQMLLYVLIPFWAMENEKLVAAKGGLRLALGLYLGWIVAFDLLDVGVGGIVGLGREWGWLEDVVGLPTLLLGMLLLCAILNAARFSEPWPRASSDRLPEGVPR